MKKYLFKNLLSIIISLSILSCYTTCPDIYHRQVKPIPMKVPGWFASRPAQLPAQLSGVRFAYGYSGKYIDKDQQEKLQKESAASNLAKEIQVELETGWAGVQIPGKGLSASYITEKKWETRAKNISENIHVIKEYYSGCGIISLAVFSQNKIDSDQIIASIDTQLIDINYDSPPSWFSKAIIKKDAIYGVGLSSHYAFSGDAWLEAEKQARADIVFQLISTQDHLKKRYSDNFGTWTKILSENKAKMVLNNVQIVKHAYCQKNKTFYALAKMSLK